MAYLLANPEVDNFTYDLGTEFELSWLAETFHPDRGQVAEVVEGMSNERVWERLTDATERKLSMKTAAPLGRRLGYVIAPLLRPYRIVETGIHDEICSLVLLAGLQKKLRTGTTDIWRRLTLIAVRAGSWDHILDGLAGSKTRRTVLLWRLPGAQRQCTFTTACTRQATSGLS